MLTRDYYNNLGMGGIARLLRCALAVTLMIAMQQLAAQAADAARREHRPYSDDSPWNLPIGPNPAIDRDSDIYIGTLKGVFGANPEMYSTPVYLVDDKTPLRDVVLSGWWSKVIDEGRELVKERFVTVRVPIPDGAQSATGKDANIVLWNPDTGEEWGFWQAFPQADGTWIARNGYAYNTRWNAVPPEGFISRGAGLPYLAGLLRPWELRRGKIEHALAFAIDYPSPLHVYPATKSDGEALPPALPEGARLQLDPTLTTRDFEAWGLSREGQIIARALQEYGMILTDGSGHPKLSVEYEGTARWGDLLDRRIVRNIPYTAFRVLDLQAPAHLPPPSRPSVALTARGVELRWQRVDGANRYQVLRRAFPERDGVVIANNVTETNYVDATVSAGRDYEYAIRAVSRNGISPPSVIAVIAVPEREEVR